MPKHHPIQYDEIDKLGVDGDNNLYWDGERVVTNMKLTLPWWANVAVVAVAVVTVLNYLGVTPVPEQDINVNLIIQHQDLERPKSSEEGD